MSIWNKLIIKKKLYLLLTILYLYINIIFNKKLIMNKNKKIYLWIILIWVWLLFIIFIYCNWLSCIINNNRDNTVQEVSNKNQEKKIIEPIIITPKMEFNASCNKITSKEYLLDFIQNEGVVLDDETKLIITDYVNNQINKSDLENKLLELIWNTDDENAKKTRLHLNFLFLKINDIERWNITNCDAIFDQYNK